MQKVNDYTLDLKKKQVRRPWERKKKSRGAEGGDVAARVSSSSFSSSFHAVVSTV